MIEEKNTRGVIYILTNPSFKEYIKIGYADNVERRLSELNRRTAIPYAFRIYATYQTTRKLSDIAVHELIDLLDSDLRTVEEFNGKKRQREFYAMSPEDAYQLLECVAKISGTENRLKKYRPTESELADERNAIEIEHESKKAPFRFSMCQIEPGETVVSVDNPDIIATVVDDRHIRYNNEIMSLSALARIVKGAPDAPLAGPQYFTYNGEKLCDLREKLGN